MAASTSVETPNRRRAALVGSHLPTSPLSLTPLVVLLANLVCITSAFRSTITGSPGTGCNHGRLPCRHLPPTDGRPTLGISRQPWHLHDHPLRPFFSTTAEAGNQDAAAPGNMQRLFFDVSVEGDGDDFLGRLVFHIPPPEDHPLPTHAENVIRLATGAARSVDPRATYAKCKFRHSPQSVEGYPQYRWAHVLDGRGRNAVGRPDERIVDPDGLRRSTHSIYGGRYHGIRYSDPADDDDIDGRGGSAPPLPPGCDSGVVLTVPLVGPGRGSSSLSIVRVGESPQEWRERLLLNSAVIGWMEAGESLDVLRAMARQTRGPPVVKACGLL